MRSDAIVSLGDVAANRPPHRDFPGDVLRVLREAVRSGWLRPVTTLADGRKPQGLWFRQWDVDRLWALPTARYQRRTARFAMWHLRDQFGWRVATIARLFGCGVREARTQIAAVRQMREHMTVLT